MFALLIYSMLAQAAFREPGDMPGPRSLCRRAEMHSCIQEHAGARVFQMNAIAEIDDKLQMLAKDRETISQSVRANESEIRSARITGEMADRERLEMRKIPRPTPIFPNGPELEEIFFLQKEPDSWQEMHEEKRRARLLALSNSSLEKIGQMEPLQRNLTMEIEALASSAATLQAERFQRGQQVNLHAGMCNEGCKMQFCSDN